MFFQVFDEKINEKDRWCLVWNLEVSIHSTILAYEIPSIQKRSAKNLANLFLKYFLKDRTDLPPKDKEWAKTFIEEQLPHIQQVVSKLSADFVDHYPRKKGMEFLEANFDRCLRESEEFRDHI
jgi:hypothetical protein